MHHRIVDMIGFVASLGLQTYAYTSGNESKIALSNDELKKLKAELEALKKKSELDIRIGVPLSTDTSCHKM